MNTQTKQLFFAFLLLLSTSYITSCVKCHPEREERGGRHLEMAVLYQQRAAEYKALCFQAFNTARLMLEKDLENKEITKKRALVFDIDETVLDNSPYEAKFALEGISYPEKWKDWCQMGKAAAVPGAKEFIKESAEKGYAIIYISNRKAELFEKTKDNLRQAGLVLENDSLLMMREGDDNSKEARRQRVLQNYHISLLFGDNLADFDVLYENKTMAQRDSLTMAFKNEFGRRFIILPNAMYGDWEMALYDNNGKMPAEEKALKRKENLISF
ncbi:MAG: Lipoprotein E precursor [Bacteroidetes bacterium ADurb.Bin408]|nr:MAG: Lipoprotein E precursor [Bacteroidetes bacterium ADurb.Bin408]